MISRLRCLRLRFHENAPSKRRLITPVNPKYDKQRFPCQSSPPDLRVYTRLLNCGGLSPFDSRYLPTTDSRLCAPGVGFRRLGLIFSPCRVRSSQTGESISPDELPEESGEIVRAGKHFAREPKLRRKSAS